MSTTPLLPLPDGLSITSISEAPDALLVRVTSQHPSSVCPRCGKSSQAIHSYYRRKPMDLPCAGRPICKSFYFVGKNWTIQRAVKRAKEERK